ncbi:lysozyme inhibitor LprI family protein [Cribrihabitans sp. XS_ASV171]
MRPAFFSACLALAATGAAAQEVNCTDPQSQMEMTACASLAYEAADGDLNAAWPLAMDMARRLDQSLQPDQKPAVEILRDAQRQWIAFRDAACSAESLLARGGTMQNQLFYICMERLTRQRTEDLRRFGEVN